MIGRLAPYERMRPSGAEWIGNIPEHWTVAPLGSLTSAKSEKGITDLPLLSVLREKGVVLRSDLADGENNNVMPDDLAAYKVVRKGDLVINKMKAWQGSLGLAPCDGVVSPAYFVFELTMLNIHFAERMLRSRSYVDRFARASDGVRIGQWDLGIPAMKRIECVIPTVGEQAAIVRFLNYFDMKNRRSIAAKQKLIGLLQEQKLTVVQNAVLRGLDPNAPMKQSGVKWLGAVPSHWPVGQLRRLFRAVFRTEAVGDEPKMSLSRSRGFIRSDDLGTRAAMSAMSVAMSVCVPGDLVMNKYQAQAGLFGSAKQRGLITANYTVFCPVRNLNTDYFRLLLASRTFNDIFAVASRGVGDGMTPLYNSAFYATNVPEPPLEEQDAIVRFVDEQVAAIDRTISTAKREIELLQEYRTRLVADVVTGKLDVRDAAAMLPDLEPERVRMETKEELIADDDTGTIDAFAEEEFAE